VNLRLAAGTMVVLIGPSGAGKSTFAARHFAPSQILSSDALREMVADDANDQSATDAAFELLHAGLGMRLARRLVTVVDATSVEGWARQRLLAVSRRHGRPAVAIVFDLPVAICLERNAARADRRLPAASIRRQHARMRASLNRLATEGFEPILMLSTTEAVQAVSLERDGA
jgi:protein phosphatase